MSIASRITSIEGHISDIYDSVELTGVDTTDIDKNLVNVPNTLKEGYIDIINNGTDTLYNNFPKVSGEGTSLTLNNTYQAPMRNNLKGNTSQTGTPTPTSPIPVNVVSGDNEIVVNGKNLWGGFTQYSNSNNGVSFTVNENGSYYANGTATATASLTVNNLKTNNIYKSLQAGTYTMSKTSNKVQLQAYDVDTTTLLLNITTSNTSGSFTLTNTTNVALRISVPNGTSVNDTFTIMLEKGSSASQYEPYQNNTYNIDLPVENLLNLTQVTLIGSGSTQSNVQTNSITLNGKSAWSNTYFFITNTNKNTNYTASCKAFSSIARKSGISIYGASDTSGSGLTPINSVIEDMSANVSKTYINSFNSGNYEYLAIRLWTNGTGTSLDSNVDLNISEIMLELGTKVNTFVPYGTTPIELCKIGNYQDYFYKDSDKWYLHKEIKKLVLNGSESFPLSKNTSPYVFTYVVDDYKYVAERIIYCNYFEGTTNGIIGTMVNGETHFRYYTDGTFGLYFCTADYSNTTDFTNWVSTHNIIAYYVLATPTNTEITDTTLINQLEELYIAKSKENQTNISQINNDLPFIISASALKKG